MHSRKNRFAELAVRVEQGDPEASLQLRRELAVALVRIVREVLRTCRPSTPFARRILTAALEEAARAQVSLIKDREQLVGPVACCLCDAIMEEVRSGPRHDRETVCDFF